jgi:hypothetical protein
MFKDKNGKKLKYLDMCVYNRNYEESLGGQLSPEFDYIFIKDGVYYWGISVLTEDLASQLEIVGTRG